jgi:hypothetical protein
MALAPVAANLTERDKRDFVLVEVLAALFQRNVAGDAGTGKRHEKFDIHCVDLNDSFVKGIALGGRAPRDVRGSNSGEVV